MIPRALQCEFHFVPLAGFQVGNCQRSRMRNQTADADPPFGLVQAFWRTIVINEEEVLCGNHPVLERLPPEQVSHVSRNGVRRWLVDPREDLPRGLSYQSCRAGKLQHRHPCHRSGATL